MIDKSIVFLTARFVNNNMNCLISSQNCFSSIQAEVRGGAGRNGSSVALLLQVRGRSRMRKKARSVGQRDFLEGRGGQGYGLMHILSSPARWASERRCMRYYVGKYGQL